jgi:hypothetical protein
VRLSRNLLFWFKNDADHTPIPLFADSVKQMGVALTHAQTDTAREEERDRRNQPRIGMGRRSRTMPRSKCPFSDSTHTAAAHRA